MRGSSVLASAVLAALLVFGGLWVLDNTSVGLRIKCQVFHDVGACFIAALSEPAAPSGGGPVFQPPATESPEDRATREAAEEAERKDQAVRDASVALGRAIDDLVHNAESLNDGAADMASSVDDVRSSLDDLRSNYADMKDEAAITPMDDFQQGSVCAALGGVEAGIGGVEAAEGGFEAASSPFESALDDRGGYVAAVRSAVADLEAAEAANPDGVRSGSSGAPHTADDGRAAIASADQTAKAAATKAAKAKLDVASLLKSADSIMSKASKLGKAVAGC